MDAQCMGPNVSRSMHLCTCSARRAIHGCRPPGLTHDRHATHRVAFAAGRLAGVGALSRQGEFDAHVVKPVPLNKVFGLLGLA